jgi:DNA replication and repair protein RecF
VVKILQTNISKVYSQIADSENQVEIEYQNGLKELNRQYIINKLTKNRHLDIARGYSTLGPHRSDFSVKLNNQPASITASRGEQRSMALAIKSIEALELEKITELQPIMLLDDITGELDTQRVKNLLKLVKPYQVFATAAHDSSLLEKIAHGHINLEKL